MIRGKTPKLVSLTALLWLMATGLLGQTDNFHFIQHDTAYVGNEEFVVLHGEIISLTSNALSLTVTRVTHERVSAWFTSFCVGPACLPPFLDTYTFELAGSDTAEFTLDTYPNGEPGRGSWTIFAVDSATMEVDSVHITMEVVTTALDGSIPVPGPFELSFPFPNPTNASVSFDLELEQSGEYEIVLYALDGREVLSRNYQLKSGKNHLQWSLKGLASGNYIISASGPAGLVSRQISVIK